MSRMEGWRERLGQALHKLGIDRLLLAHSGLLFIATVIGQGLAFIAQALVARTIGVDSYGLYAFAFTWISLSSMLAILGSDRLLVRFIGEYRAAGDSALLHGILRWSFLVSMGLAIGLALLMLAGGFGIIGFVGEAATVLLWSALVLPLMVLASWLENALRGFERHGAATLPNVLVRPALFTGLVILFASHGAGAGWALALNAAAIATAGVMCAIALVPCLPSRPGVAVALPRRSWFAASAMLGLNTLALHLNSQLDMLVIGLFRDAAALGVYGAAVRIVTIVGLCSTTVITIFQPMIVAARTSGDHARVLRLCRGGARLIFLAAAGLGVALLLGAELALSLFGPGFEEGATAMRILAFGQIVGGLFSLAAPLLNMTGHQRAVTMVMIGGASANLVLNLLLVPWFGIIGAASATAAATIGWNAALFITARRRLAIDTFPLELPATSARARHAGAPS